MDPVTAFGLAAGVVQLVNFSAEALSKCREVYNDGSLAEHRSTEEVTQRLADTTDRLRASLIRTPKPLAQSDQDILDLSSQCSETAENLLRELEGLKANSKGGFRQAVSKSIRAIRRRAFMKEVQSKLDRYQDILNTQILVGLKTQSIEQTSNFEHLDQDVRNLVVALNSGLNTVAQIVAGEAQAIRDHYDRQLETQERAKRENEAQKHFLDSLFFSEIFARQEQIPRVHDGTCRWILEPPGTNASDRNLPNFIDWLRHGDSIYWLNGKPGSGKSSLMKYISDEVLSNDFSKDAVTTWANGAELVRASFFFWRGAGASLQNDLRGFLRSILFQIGSQGQNLVRIMMDRQSNSAGNTGQSIHPPQRHAWTEERLIATLQRLLQAQSPSVNFCFFIDGLDEFDGDEDKLIEIIRLLNSTLKTKLCVSSRPEQIFRRGFSKSPQLRLQDFNAKDIEKAATDYLSPALMELFPRSEDAIQKLTETVIRKAEGVFLWIDLVTKDLKKGARNADTFRELEERLDIIPDTVEGVYEHMFSRLHPLYLEEAFIYFKRLLRELEHTQVPRAWHGYGAGSRPMTLLHFTFAESEPWARIWRNDFPYFESLEFHDLCTHIETRILTRCAGLVEIQEQAPETLSSNRFGTVMANQEANVSRHIRQVKFIHRTVIDFLQDQWFFNDSDWRFAADIDLLHGKIGYIGLMPLVVAAETFQIAERSLEFHIGWQIQDVMDIIYNLSESNVSTQREPTLKHSGVGIVDQVFEIVERVDASLNSSDMHWYERYTLACFRAEDDCKVPFRDTLRFAAFFGCHSYISHHESLQTCSPAQANYLVECITLGLIRDHVIDRSFPESISLIQKLLSQGADPNAPLIVMHEREGVNFQETLSIWGCVFSTLIDMEWMIDSKTTVWVGHEDDQVSAPVDTTSWPYITAVESFISHNAEINTGILRFVDLPSTYEKLSIVEESPLSLLKTSGKYIWRPVVPPLVNLLRSHGAVERRRFLYFFENPDESLESSHLYQVSEEQSQSLCEWWPQDHGNSKRDRNTLDDAFEELKPNLKEIEFKEGETFIIQSSWSDQSSRSENKEPSLSEEPTNYDLVVRPHTSVP